MQHTKIKKLLAKAMSLAVICLIVFTSSAKAGLDYYEIYLGKKLLFKRSVNQPLSLESLPLNASNTNEQLVVHYFQCNAPGKIGSKRSIVLKDEDGNIVKRWNYPDTKSADQGMTIPVKELMQTLKKGKSKMLSLIYTAEGKTGGEKMTYIDSNI